MFEDKCLNMNRVVWQFYQYVNAMKSFEFLYDGDKPNHRYTFKAKPYFNGFQSGFVIEIWDSLALFGGELRGCIAFYEHLNADAKIFMGLYFVPDETRTYYTSDDIPEQYLSDKVPGERFGSHHFPDFEKAVDYIRESVRLVAAQNKVSDTVQNEISDTQYDAYLEGVAEAGEVA